MWTPTLIFQSAASFRESPRTSERWGGWGDLWHCIYIFTCCVCFFLVMSYNSFSFIMISYTPVTLFPGTQFRQVLCLLPSRAGGSPVTVVARWPSQGHWPWPTVALLWPIRALNWPAICIFLARILFPCINSWGFRACYIDYLSDIFSYSPVSLAHYGSNRSSR